jgi:hypothetical protein
MSAWKYRPFTDTWLLARPKLKGGETYYGAYPAGFLGRARRLLGCRLDEPMLHVCGGKARLYPFWGFGPNDRTLDLDGDLAPDFCQDARKPWPCLFTAMLWRTILCDPPYSEEEAAKYKVGAIVYPTPEELLDLAVDALVSGGKIGILHYMLPRFPKKHFEQIAIVNVYVGNGNRTRAFSVFERK